MAVWGRICMLAFLIALSPEFAASRAGKNSQEKPKEGAGAHVVKSEFGKLPDGTEIEAYTLHNSRGASVKVITYGATLTELHVPDRHGKMGDVVLGFDNLQGYLGQHPYF